MKKIISILLLLVLGISTFALTGCSAMFDLMNSNRRPLPAIESPVDGSLVNPHPKTPASLTKAGLMAIASAQSERTQYEDSLDVQFSSTNQNSTNFFNSISLAVVEQGDSDAPYALYNSSSYDQYHSFFVFDDGITSMYDQYKYAFDEHFDLLDIPVMDYILAGGLAPTLLNAVANSFAAAYDNYVNGKQMLEIELYGQGFADHISSIISVSDKSMIGKYKSTSAVELVQADEKLSLSLTMSYENGNIDIYFQTRIDDVELHYYGPEKIFVPSYIYLLRNLVNKYADRSYPKLEFSAEVEYFSHYDFYDYGKSGTAKLFRAKAPPYDVYSNTSYYYGPQHFMGLEIGNEIAYLDARSYNYGGVLEKNGKYSLIESAADDAEKYYALIDDFYYSTLYFPFRKDLTVDIASTDGGYKIDVIFSELQQTGGYWDEDLEQYIATYTTITDHMEVEVNSDFSRLKSISTTQRLDDEVQSRIAIIFDHTVIRFVPKGVTDYWTDYYDSKY